MFDVVLVLVAVGVAHNVSVLAVVGVGHGSDNAVVEAFGA